MTEGGLVRDCVKGLGEIVTLCQVVCLISFCYKHIPDVHIDLSGLAYQ